MFDHIEQFLADRNPLFWLMAFDAVRLLWWTTLALFAWQAYYLKRGDREASIVATMYFSGSFVLAGVMGRSDNEVAGYLCAGWALLLALAAGWWTSLILMKRGFRHCLDALPQLTLVSIYVICIFWGMRLAQQRDDGWRDLLVQQSIWLWAITCVLVVTLLFRGLRQYLRQGQASSSPGSEDAEPTSCG